MTGGDSRNKKERKRRKAASKKQNQTRILILTYKKGKGIVELAPVSGSGRWTLVVHSQSREFNSLEFKLWGETRSAFTGNQSSGLWKGGSCSRMLQGEYLLDTVRTRLDEHPP